MNVVLPAVRVVQSYRRGTHFPDPYLAEDGWRCHKCLLRLRTYRSRWGERRLRHWPDGPGLRHGRTGPAV